MSDLAVFDLSVVIVGYKTRDVVCDCLHSLYAGGGLRGVGSAEVIVVDNASGDGTADAVRAEFPDVRMVALDENRGFAGANNVGLDLSSGRNVLLLNPDTLAPDGSLAACVRYLDAQPPNVGAMSCRVESADGSIQWTCARRLMTPGIEISRAFLLDRAFPRSRVFNGEALPGWNRHDERAVECVLGAFVLMRRTALDAIGGGLDARFFLMYEDVDLCKRIGDAGFKIMFWPGVHITHLGGQSWKHAKIETYANSHVSALLYFQKHHPRAVGVVRFAVRAGMELKILLLRLNALRKRGGADAYTREHLAMARAARNAIRTGAFPLPAAPAS